MALPGKKTPPVTKQTAAPAAAGPMTPEKLGQGLGKAIEGIKALHAKMDALTELFTSEITALNEKIDMLAEGGGEGGEEAGTITADDVRQMKKADLVQLITDYGLEIDPEDYPKVGDLRTAIIALMEEGGDEGGDGGEAGEEAGGGW